MPHIIVEYSCNIEPACCGLALLQSVHKAALGSGIFDPSAVRTRATPRSLFRVGHDDDPRAGFIHITARIRPGRTTETQESLLRTLMDAAQGYLRSVGYSAPLMLNVEIHELPASRLGSRW